MKQPVDIIKLESHLYATVSKEVEAVKEGDWCYHPKVSKQYTYIENGVKSKKEHIAQGVFKYTTTTNPFYKGCRKIVATTNPFFWMSVYTYNDQEGKVLNRLPKISEEFIEQFTNAPEDEYEIEYKNTKLLLKPRRTHSASSVMKSLFDESYGKELKTYENDTVNITAIEKQLYSSSDIESLREHLKNDVDAKADNGSMRVSDGNLYWTFGGNIGDVIIDETSIDNSIDNWIKSKKIKD